MNTLDKSWQEKAKKESPKEVAKSFSIIGSTYAAGYIKGVTDHLAAVKNDYKSDLALIKEKLAAEHPTNEVAILRYKAMIEYIEIKLKQTLKPLEK